MFFCGVNCIQRSRVIQPSVTLLAICEFGSTCTKPAWAWKKIVDDPALRQAAINAVVAGYNATAQWKASFKTVDLPPV